MKLFLRFGYVCCLANVLPLLFPSIHLLYFVPFIVLTFYRTPFNQALWWSFGCGLFLDLYSSQTRLGTYALNYCLSTLCLYRYNSHFFEDRLSTLPAMTFFYSCVSQFIQSVLLFAIDFPFHFSWNWVQTDLLMIPLQTSLYGVLAFHLPTMGYAQIKKRYSLLRYKR